MFSACNGERKVERESLPGVWYGINARASSFFRWREIPKNDLSVEWHAWRSPLNKFIQTESWHFTIGAIESDVMIIFVGTRHSVFHLPSRHEEEQTFGPTECFCL